jgi:hypothetical protein
VAASKGIHKKLGKIFIEIYNSLLFKLGPLPGSSIRTHTYQKDASGISNTNIRVLFFNLLEMEYESNQSTLYKMLEHVAHKLHYSKVDTIGRNITSVLLTSWENSLQMCRSCKHTSQMEHN